MELDTRSYGKLSSQADQLRHLGHIDDEIALRLQMLKLRPNDHRCELSLALALLLKGRYKEGWPHYEARLAGSVAIQVPKHLPRWDGQSELSELLLIAEQGIGDLVQSLRYIPLLARRFRCLSIIAPPQCCSLLHHCGLFHHVYGFQEPLELGDGCAWLPLMSIPLVLELTAEQVGAKFAYLKAEPNQKKTWQERLRTTEANNKVIALHWQGNPLAEQGSAQGRSFPLELLKPIAGISGLRLVALQKGAGAEQLADCTFMQSFVDCQEIVNHTWDLVETLAILSACDLVITSDSALAHLAGALGRPTWIMLKAVPDWRWGLTGQAMTWYPATRLFRQAKPGDWDSVITEVYHALLESNDNGDNQALSQTMPQADDIKDTRPMDLFGPLLSYREAIFQAHCSFVLATYLQPWISFFYTPKPRHSRLEAVIVETRPSPVLRAVIINALLMLPAGTLIILITSKQAEEAMAKLFEDLGDVLEIRAGPLHRKFDPEEYNYLLCEPSFWQGFSTECILIFQSDSLLLEPLPESFLSAAYLGAPWYSDGELSIDFPYYAGSQGLTANSSSQTIARASVVFSPGLAEKVPHGYGNGGLSIRNRALMAAIATEQVRENGEPEDVFFSRHLPAYCVNMPDIELARQFSVESIYADAIGFHASWKYLPTDKQALLYEKHIKTLISMAAGLL